MRIKAILSLCMIAVLLISLMAFSVNAAEKLTANVKKGTPVIDGVADEIWNHVDEIQIGIIKNSGDSPNDGIAIKGAVPTFKFESGTTFGWDVQLNDSDTDAEVRNHCLGWNDEANEVWQNPTYMGTLVFSADEAAPPITEEVVEATAETSETAPVQVEITKTPQTNDNVIIFAGMIMIALAAFVTIRKVRNN